MPEGQRIEGLIQDLRYAFRQLRHAPGYLSAWLPARRASRVEPRIAMQEG